MSIFGSNEEMLAKLQAGSTGWDVFVPTNYTISTYKELDLIEPIDLKLMPNYDLSTQDPLCRTRHHRRHRLCRAEGLGHHRFRRQHQERDAESDELEGILGPGARPLTGRVMVHDYQLTTIGNALKSFGYSFNSNDEKELGEAEKAPVGGEASSVRHQLRLSAVHAQRRRLGLDGWTNDAAQMHRDIAGDVYVLGKEGGEIWSDFYAVPKGAPNREAAYALIDYLLTPEINAKEVVAHGYPSMDSRTNKLVPKEMLENPILYPAAEALAPLEFGAAATLTNPLRAEIMARFKSA